MARNADADTATEETVEEGRWETYTIKTPKGVSKTIRRNVDTGEQTVS